MAHTYRAQICGILPETVIIYIIHSLSLQDGLNGDHGPLIAVFYVEGGNSTGLENVTRRWDAGLVKVWREKTATLTNVQVMYLVLKVNALYTINSRV